MSAMIPTTRFPLASALGALAIAAFAALTPVSAEAGLTQAPCDFVTMGVVLIKDNGWWSDLGGQAGCRRGEPWGQVSYVDHEFHFHMTSVEITAYLYDPAVPNARDICGWGVVSDYPGNVRFRIRVQDNGSPGTNDMVGIVIDPGYAAYRVSFRRPVNGGPGGGNVELHQETGPNKAPGFFTPQESQACGGLPPP
jgi:hypothetical protein